MRRAAFLLAWLIVAAVVMTAGTADAHPRAGLVESPLATVPVASPPAPSAPVEILHAAASEPGAPWLALVLIAAGGAAALSRQRRVVAVTLVAVVALLAFEIGVHSTHHLGKPDDAAQCVVASTSAQLAADVVDASVDDPVLAPLPDTPAVASAVFVARTIAPDRGRAPPALSV